MSNYTDIFGGGGVPLGAIVQGQFAADSNYLPCDGGDYIKASYPQLDTTALDTYGANTPVSRTIPRSGNTKVAYGAGLFVAVTPSTNQYSTSPDGVTWTTRTLGGTPGSSVDIVFAAGIFVVVGFGTGACITSPDGVNWTVRTIPADVSSWLRVRYAGGLFFAFQDWGGSASKLATSPDGITWTLRTAAFTNPYSVAYGGGLYVTVHYTTGASGVLGVSLDGINWVQRSILAPSGSGITAVGWDSVVYLNGKWLIATGAGAIYVSSDGLGSFAQIGLLTALATPASIKVVNGTFYTLPAASSAQVYSTVDFQNFKAFTLTDTAGADSLAIGNNALVFGCLSGANLKSVAVDTTKFRTPVVPKNSDGDRYYIKAK